jgi:hypothetical protein
MTANDLLNIGYTKKGNWFLHKSNKVSLNLASNTIRGHNPDFVIERKDNDVSVDDINTLSDLLIKLVS